MNDDRVWNAFPPELAFLVPVIREHEAELDAYRDPGHARLAIDERMRADIQTRLHSNLDADTRRRLRTWVNTASNSRPSEKRAMWLAGAVLLLIGDEQCETDLHNEECEALRTELPSALHYVIPTAAKYALHTETDVDAKLSHLATDDLRELKSLGNQILQRGDSSRIYSYVQSRPLQEQKSAAWLYFLLMLMDYADIEFD